MRKLCLRLHLWLGLLSGIIVFVVCLTGALYAFKDELTAIGKPWLHVTPQASSMLPPSQLLSHAAAHVPQLPASAITYGSSDEAAWIDYGAWTSDTTARVYIDPYTGHVQHAELRHAADFDFFDFLLQGHVRLWLPRAWGSPVVGGGVLIFLVTLITGVVIWYPRQWNRKTLRSRFTLHRPIRWRRLVYDAHSVVGIYVLLPLIIASFTGLIFAFGWFASGVYALASGGEQYVAYVMPQSDTTQVAGAPGQVDRVYRRMVAEEPRAVQVYYALPQSASDVIRVSVVHERGSYYRQDNRFFDAGTARELQGEGAYAGRYTDKTPAQRLMRMSLDLHEGRIIGLPGRILWCLSALVGASLPVTGLILYLRRRRARVKTQ